ncbi:Heat shock 70 kDa protein 14 [Geodia barretti]|uniref:Heat shock 70 kDa protein 14 n=1 Tax=Geodia barretti TaxID=519541 RepID=A0AA35WW35_GEOBA|nr:Heat shock 70 kDa protein 14 [Geodia barretti]
MPTLSSPFLPSSLRIPSHVMVYNLGAHTLTLSLLLVAGGMYSQLATKTVWDSVGGNEFDKAIADFLASEFEKQRRVSIHGNEKCRFKLLAAAESAKHALSRVQTTAVHVESVHDGLDLTYSLSRGRFEGLCTAVFRRCVNSDLITGVLSDGGVTRGDVARVIMAGGSCNIPQLHSLLESEFPGSEILSSSPSPEVAVATGCALEAGLIKERWEGRGEEEDGVQVPCVPHDLWIKGARLRDHLLLPSLTPLPSHSSLSFSLPLEEDASLLWYSLELWEKRSTNQETEIAKVSVPVGVASGETGEDVSVKVSLVWTAENAVTMTTTKRDSDWSITLNLTCDE